MGIEDRDAIDRALDAAEAIQESRIDDDAIVESPSIPADVTEDPIAEAEALKDNPAVRNAQGKTLPTKAPKWQPRVKPDAETQVSSQVANEEATGLSNGNEPPQAATEPLPAFWPDSLKQLAAKTPDKALVKEFAAQTAKYEGSFRQVAQDRDRYKEVVNRVYDGWDNVKAEAAKHGIEDPMQELQNYREWDKTFTEDIVLSVRDIVAKNNLTPQHIFGPPGQQQHFQQVDPRYNELQQTTAQVRAELDRIKADAESQRQASLAGELNDFRSGVDSVGDQRAPHMERFAPQIAEVIQVMRQEYPHLSRQELLHHSYECVMQDVRGSYGAPQPAPAMDLQTRIDNAKRARSAASGLSGAPTTSVAANKPKLKGKDWRSKLDSAVDHAEERQGIR